jgi:hypothetical protein
MNKNRVCILVLLISNVMFFTGCATITTGKSQKIQITSEPSEANVTIYNNDIKVWESTTPTVYSLKRAGGDTKYRIVIDKAGYQPSTTLIKTGINMRYWGNFLLMATGALLVSQYEEKPKIETEWGVKEWENNFYTTTLPGGVFFSLGTASAIIEPFTNKFRSFKPSKINVKLQQTFQGALKIAILQIAKDLPADSRIVIVDINSPNKNTSDFIIFELEHTLRENGFTLVDRMQLDKLREEQVFGMSGEVDDETAASVGRFVGANVAITGIVHGEGELRRLRLRALEVSTGRVLGTASQRF